MSVTLRIVLIVLSVLDLGYVIHKIRFSKMQIEYALFWIALSIMFILLAVFPVIAYKATELLGVMSTANLIFLAIIGILLLKVFMMTIELSVLENKVRDLVQQLGIDEKNNRDEYKKMLVKSAKVADDGIEKKGSSDN
ncbi:MAG: DUF2304 domain-containing protein [Lachnospiraceae bacterium]|jgi:hypothetical protein|nr:DUF2304 domain-containing protein [Lachnospiraceae bacterium]